MLRTNDVSLIPQVARGFTRGAFEVKPFTDDKAEKNQHQVAISILKSSEARTKNHGQNVTIVPVKKSKARRK